MTISTTSTRSPIYAGSGTTGPFPVPFEFGSNSDLVVIKRDPSGIESVLTLNTDYTVSGAGDPSGGSITLISALATGYKLVILLGMSPVQETVWPENDPFPSESHEEAIDRLTLLLQQVKEAVERAPQLQRSLALRNIFFPTPVPNSLLGWSASGDAIVNYPTTEIDVPEIDGIANYADSLNSAVAQIGSEPSLLLINKGITVTEALTVPKNILLWIPPGGGITVDGVELKVHQVMAGRYQIFTYAAGGSVSFESSTTAELSPSWFPGDDIGEQVNAALAAVSNDNAPIVRITREEWVGKTYSESIVLNKRTTLAFDSSSGDEATIYLGATAAIQIQTARSKITGGIHLDLAGNANSDCDGILLTASIDCVLPDDLWVQNAPRDNIRIDGYSANGAYQHRWGKVRTGDCGGTGIRMTVGELSFMRSHHVNYSTDSITVDPVFYSRVSTGHACRVRSIIGILPSPLAYEDGGGTKIDYYAIKTETPNVIKLASSLPNALAGTAVNLTDAGVGENVLMNMDIGVSSNNNNQFAGPVVINGTCGSKYGILIESGYNTVFTNFYSMQDGDTGAVSAVDATADTLTIPLALYNILYHGNAVKFSTTGSLPGGMSTTATYYAIKTTTPGLIKLATTLANALAGTAVNLTDAGSGTHTCKDYGVWAIYNGQGSHSNTFLGSVIDASVYNGVITDKAMTVFMGHNNAVGQDYLEVNAGTRTSLDNTFLEANNVQTGNATVEVIKMLNEQGAPVEGPSTPCIYASDGSGASAPFNEAGTMVFQGSQTSGKDIYFLAYVGEAFAKVLGILATGNVQIYKDLIIPGAWDTGCLRLGSNYLWIDGSNRLRIKPSAPTSASDGTIVGLQS